MQHEASVYSSMLEEEEKEEDEEREEGEEEERGKLQGLVKRTEEG